MEGVASCEVCLAVSQPEVVPTSQGCSELGKWLGKIVTHALRAAQTQNHASRLPGYYYPIVHGQGKVIAVQYATKILPGMCYFVCLCISL